MCVIVELLRSIVQKIWRGVIIFTYTIQIILSHLLQDFILIKIRVVVCFFPCERWKHHYSILLNEIIYIINDNPLAN